MLLTVREFCARTADDMQGLVLDLQQATGRRTESEARAWTNSLTRVADVLGQSGLANAHVQLGRTSVSVEYRLPAASYWCDVVLLGRGGGRPRAVLVELKDWDTVGDAAGPRENLVWHRGRHALHPSDQVRGYVEYCRAFHSGVAASSADVVGCAFFTSAQNVSPYVQSPHDSLVANYPVFSSSLRDLQSRMPDWLRSQIDQDDPAFALAFERGLYRQERSLLRQVAQSFQQSQQPYFVLLDEQRLGLEECLATIDEVLAESGTRGKATILVQGPPGSGKSVLATQLWARLATDQRIRGNVVFVTTSGCQRSNWQQLFDHASDLRGGSGLVVPANRFNPGLTTSWVRDRRASGYAIEIETWKTNVEDWVMHCGTSRMPDNSVDVAIVDEAHALIDPTAPGARGVSPSGWTMHAGPQAWHIQRAARVSIFLLDSAQSYRDNETTGAESIVHCARDLGIKTIRTVDLEGAQFRCGGAREYVDWLESLLSLRSLDSVKTDWRRVGGRGAFEFEVVPDPLALDERLRERWREGRSVRLASSYSKPWKTQQERSPHDVKEEARDFVIPFERNGTRHLWSRVWNFAPAQDYTLFVQAPPGTRMHDDPLSEVGCPYVLRGFDFDYLGILWCRDLIWRNGWHVDIGHVHESAWRMSVAALRRAPSDAAARQRLIGRLLRGYRILLSRAMHGLYVWIEDDETREHVRHALIGH